MLIDTHAHLNFHDYDQDRKKVFKRALDNDVWLINVGAQYSSSQRAVDYTKEYPIGVYAAVGLHPIHLEDQAFQEGGKKINIRKEIFNQEKYRKLASTDKVVAIGETGLDYYRIEGATEEKEKIKRKQKQIFKHHLELAKELNLPVILHCREAHSEMLEILKDHQVTGVSHCFSGTKDQLQKYLDLGFYISFTGIVTFPKAENIRKLVKLTPIEKILLETDCPFLTPEPYRGKRNEPSYVRYVAEKIGEIKGISFEEVAKITTNNAKKLFNF